MPSYKLGFGTLDLLFFLGYFVIVLGIGFAVGRKERATIGDYFRAGNTLPWFAVGFSIIAAGISSEQFVGEIGYAYKLGMPVLNWEWLVFPALSIFLWIFVPLYVRNKITTMPEYLEMRYGPRARTLYAGLIVASYILANFALVFFTAGLCLERIWPLSPYTNGHGELAWVWIMAVTTGAYTIYGGLKSVAWTDFFQCALLLGGGIFVFFKGMGAVGWDFQRVLSAGGNEQYGHLMASASHPEVPWTGWIILALSTNVWYYATDQFINQRCLGAKNEWHAKMGVLLAGGLQLILPLATCFPGLIYRAINPGLITPGADHSNIAYPELVKAFVPVGLRGLVVAAVLGAIMSTISGLVNSTSTMVTLDIFRRWKGRDWSEARLVTFGKWAGTIALLLGALYAPMVMKWENIFRYCQDIWAPMAAPATVVFLAGALWKKGKERGAVVCLWLAILTVPFTFVLKFLDERGYNFLPPNLANPLVYAGIIFLASIIILHQLSVREKTSQAITGIIIGCALVILIGLWSPTAIALMVLASVVFALLGFCLSATDLRASMWDRSMLGLSKGEQRTWYASLGFWWAVLAVCFVGIYYYFW